MANIQEASPQSPILSLFPLHLTVHPGNSRLLFFCESGIHKWVIANVDLEQQLLMTEVSYGEAGRAH